MCGASPGYIANIARPATMCAGDVLFCSCCNDTGPRFFAQTDRAPCVVVSHDCYALSVITKDTLAGPSSHECMIVLHCWSSRRMLRQGWPHHSPLSIFIFCLCPTPRIHPVHGPYDLPFVFLFMPRLKPFSCRVLPVYHFRLGFPDPSLASGLFVLRRREHR